MGSIRNTKRMKYLALLTDQQVSSTHSDLQKSFLISKSKESSLKDDLSKSLTAISQTISMGKQYKGITIPRKQTIYTPFTNLIHFFFLIFSRHSILKANRSEKGCADSRAQSTGLYWHCLFQVESICNLEIARRHMHTVS